MSKDLRDKGASTEQSKLGPDYFAFFNQEIQNLLSLDEGFLPFPTSIDSQHSERTLGDKKVINGHILLNCKGSSTVSGSFSQGIGGRLSDFKKERLKSLLKQTVFSLSQEVDDMLDPVLAIHQIQSQLRSRKSLKAKQERMPLSGDDQNTGSCRASDTEANTESKEVDKDLQFLVENDTASVESSVKKYSDELFMMLEHMEQQLEGLLDLLQSSNRLMTLTEKQQLQKLIQKLPPRNLDRVVEIIQKSKPEGVHSPDAIHVDLEEEDNVTLWRLYIYVKAVENARKLAG